MPAPRNLDLDELGKCFVGVMRELLAVKPDEWAQELAGQEKFFESLEPNVPEELLEEHERAGQAARSLGGESASRGAVI